MSALQPSPLVKQIAERIRSLVMTTGHMPRTAELAELLDEDPTNIRYARRYLREDRDFPLFAIGPGYDWSRVVERIQLVPGTTQAMKSAQTEVEHVLSDIRKADEAGIAELPLDREIHTKLWAVSEAVDALLSLLDEAA